MVKLAGDALDEVRRRVQQDTLGHRGRTGDPLYQIRLLLHASRHKLTPRQQERLREAFTADEAHISVEVAYLHRASARGLPSSHTRPRPTPGRTPHRAPTNMSHPRNHPPGPDPTQMKGRTRRLLRHRRSQQRTAPKPSTESSNWADAPPEATATPPTTNSECSSSPQA
ncbi:transposase [Pauljensenia sp. 20925_1_25]|uniref:transposase n=1 Tax=Pauljensenia sp. 20925_1_25 TaxID=3003692 RepID=UPI00352F74D2